MTATESKPPKQRDALEVIYADERREQITVRTLSNTDWVKWVRTGCRDDEFLVYRSVERADPKEFANQAWFDSLQRTSARAVVNLALELNGADEETKKVLAAIRANLESFQLVTPSSSSDTAATTPTA